MSHAWTLNVDRESIAWLTFDLPGEKVNKFTEPALRELEGMLDRLAADEALRAVAVISGKPGSFIVGADINELARISNIDDAREKALAGQAIFGKLAELRMPTVAVIHGACLGGGLEMALACDYRVVTDDPKTSLGQPEVNLGIIPGWGGTQRLPRLVGLPQALRMILTGKPVAGRKAYRIGLADSIVTRAFAEDQTQQFIERVVTGAGRRKIVRRRRRRVPLLMRAAAATPLGRGMIFRRAARQALERTKGNYPAPLEAVHVMRKTSHAALAKGLQIEAEAFSRLVCTPISRNLLWLFEASQRLKKAGPEAPGVTLEPVRSAAVVGAGIMGCGIAWALSRAGIPVRMKDINWEAVARGMAGAAGMFRALVKRRRMTENQMNLAMHRIAGAVDYTGFEGLDAVIEAVVENMDLKKRVLAEIEASVGPDALICTNTSSLSLEALAGSLANAERFVGLHFFNPVNRMPLVEVVPHAGTSQRALVAAVALVRRVGKTPIVVGDCPGFLVNRVLLPYLVESAWMFEEGVDAERIDELLERFGMPMGPLALADEVGLDVGHKVAKELEAAYGPRMHVADVLGRVVESAGLTGRKGGEGFYVYHNGRRKPSPRAAGLVKQARAHDGLRGGRLTDDQIVDRAVLIMINEAARCLEEGVVADAQTLDMAMVMGTGFAPFRGGLLRYADERGVEAIKDRLHEFAAAFGDRFKPAPLIEQIANGGGNFHKSNAA
ncbi:MAG: 3-hydroxyacyl-CoA dehydrogenase NAD-binding domain-containing protein [Planctomycetota bacterium]|jgi:3-hydroxyacyl-CoA dehydrogenase/enoyl-CoA hydratase/3-hydroxybutyryl-CoA epimerase